MYKYFKNKGDKKESYFFLKIKIIVWDIMI